MFRNFSTFTTGFVAGSAIAVCLLGGATEASAFSLGANLVSNDDRSITRFSQQERDYQISNSDGMELYINGDISGGFDGFIWTDSQSERIDFSFLEGGTWTNFETTFLSAIYRDATGWWEKIAAGYNVGIDGGATFKLATQISKDVPEPITGLVVAAGLGGAVLRRTKKSQQS